MYRMQFIALLIISALSFTSCASFSNKITRDQTIKLTQKNIRNIEGTYEIECYDSYFKSRTGKEIIQYARSSGNVTVNSFTMTNDIDSTLLKKLVVDIELLSDKKIKFTYRHQHTIIKETILGMKLRKNGMIHLKNRETQIMGIPLLFGGIEINRSRIGISKNNDLVVHNINHITGGALIIISDSRNHNSTFYFKRIHTSS